MTKFVLTCKENRGALDLREYGQIIADVIFSVLEDDEPLVTTSKGYYCVETDVPMTEKERVEIDELLCASDLGRYRMDGEMLFTAIEEEVGQENRN